MDSAAAGAAGAPAADLRRQQLERALSALEAAYGAMCAAAARAAVASSYGSRIAISPTPTAASVSSTTQAQTQAQTAAAAAGVGSGTADASAALPLLHAAPGAGSVAQLETSPASTAAVASQAPGRGTLASAARVSGSVDHVAARGRTPTDSVNADGSALAAGDDAALLRSPTESEGEDVGLDPSQQLEGGLELEPDADECGLCESGPIPPHDSVRCGTSDSEAHGCDRAFHLHCAGRASLPQEEWLCPTCSEVGRPVPAAAGPVE
jgi:hypothetical protein